MAAQKIVWKLKTGQITLLPQHGRVLQAEVGGKKTFWNNPNWTGDWNIGGDRLWIGPEIDWNWKTRKTVDFSKYVVPSNIDPGTWKTEIAERRFCKVRQTAELKNNHNCNRICLEIARSFSVIELDTAPYFRHWVSYHTDNELRILVGAREQQVGLWSLLQVPSGGEMIIPCREKLAFRKYFGSIPPKLKSSTSHELHCRITGECQYKIGIDPMFVNGGMAYVRPVGNELIVIYRKFFPQPWRKYCDRPMHELKSQGDAVQIYNDSGLLGGFGEMEYHSPSIFSGRDEKHLMDSCLTVVGIVNAKELQKWKNFWLR